MNETKTASKIENKLDKEVYPLVPGMEARQADKFLATIMENTTLMMAYYDTDFNFQFVSRTLCDYLKRPPSELIGHNSFKVFPEVEKDVRPLMQSVLDSGQPLNFKSVKLDYIPAATPEIPFSYWDFSYIPVLKQDIASGILSIAEDVTAQVLQRQQLEQMARQEREHAAWLEAILSSISEGIGVVDREGTFILSNPMLDKILNCPMLGRNPSRDGVKESARYLPNGVFLDKKETVSGRVLRGETFSDFRFWLITDEGQERALSASGAPLRDENNALDGGVIIFRDVTHQELQRRETEEAGRATARTQAALLELATAAAGISDIKVLLKKIVEIVPRVTGCDRVGISFYDEETQEFQQIEVFGLTPEQAEEWRNTPPAKADPHTPESIKFFVNHEAVILDMQLMEEQARQQGQELPNPYGIKTALVLPMVYKGKVMGMLSLDHNGKPYEFSPSEISVLEGMARLSAIATENVRLLIEANQAAALREANRLKDEFLSLAAHELRNPLTAVQGYTQMTQRKLRRIGIAEEDLKPLETIIAQAQRMTRLVEDLLDLSRIETGRLELRLQPCDLAEQVQLAVETYEADASRHQFILQLMNGPESSLYQAEYDADRIEQVLSNLITNAIKYSPDGGPIALKLERTLFSQLALPNHIQFGASPENSVLHFAVSDQGIGIPLEQQIALFERFYRTDNSRDSGLPGLGLGLYISSQIIALHKGYMWAESVGQNQGSTFHFVLPS